MDLNDLIVMKKVAEGLEQSTTNLAQFTAVQENIKKQEEINKHKQKFEKIKLEDAQIKLDTARSEQKRKTLQYENYQSFIKGKIEGGQTGGQPNVQAGVQAGPTADQDGSGIRFQEEGALPSLEEYNESQTLKGQRDIAKEQRGVASEQRGIAKEERARRDQVIQEEDRNEKKRTKLLEGDEEELDNATKDVMDFVLTTDIEKEQIPTLEKIMGHPLLGEPAIKEFGITFDEKGKMTSKKTLTPYTLKPFIKKQVETIKLLQGSSQEELQRFQSLPPEKQKQVLDNLKKAKK